jgi:hypothetical protein
MNAESSHLSPETVRRLTLDTEPYLSCDRCFELVDQFAEAVLADASAGDPAMRTHLTGCPACSEEARSLIELIAADAGTDASHALRGLDLA